MLAQRFFAVVLVSASALQVAAAPVNVPRRTKLGEAWKKLPKQTKVDIALHGFLTVSALAAAGIIIAGVVEAVKKGKETDIKAGEPRVTETRLVDGKTNETPGGRTDGHEI